MFSYILLGFTFLAVSKETLAVSVVCNNASVRHLSSQIYWMITELLNFTDAHKRCQDEGGILAEIPDMEAQRAINEKFPFYCNPDIWIGVNDIEEEKNFVNMLNEAVSYKNWYSGEPNNKDPKFIDDDGDCVRISSGVWRDASCSNTFPALCSQRQTIVSQTSGQTTTQLTTTYQPTGSQTTDKTTSQSTTTYQPTVSHTTDKTTSQSTTTYQPTVSPTNEQTTGLSSTRLTTKEQFRESETSEQTSTQSAETDPQSVPQTSRQATSSEQSTEGTTSSVSQKRECKCPCSRMKNRVIIKNEEELLTKIDKMKKELAVKISLLSSSIRKKTCAVDPRPSASIVGGTISVVIIATVVGIIILSDLTRVINFCWKIILKRCNRKTRAAQKGMV